MPHSGGIGPPHAVFIRATGVERGRTSTPVFTAEGELPACGHGTVAALVLLAIREGGSDHHAVLCTTSRNITDYGQNVDHQVTGITPPAGSSLAAIVIAYDGFGRLQAVRDGRGLRTIYVYDRADRIKTILYSDTTPDVAFTYDGAGNVLTRTDASGTTTLSNVGVCSRLEDGLRSSTPAVVRDQASRAA